MYPMSGAQADSAQCVQDVLVGVVPSAQGPQLLAGAPPQAFVSIALDYYPPDSNTSNESVHWVRKPGQINPDLLDRSPAQLLAVTRKAFALSIAYNATRNTAYQTEARALLARFLGGGASLEPNMRYARMVPRESLADLLQSPLGFLEMDDLPLALDAARLLALPVEDMQALDTWMRCDTCGHAICAAQSEPGLALVACSESACRTEASRAK